MGIGILIFVAISLAMDAFTVAIAKGISLKEAKPQQAAKVALFFGGFQALMPFIGWACGQSFAKYVKAFTPWIALILLGAIGGKMLYESFQKDENDGEEDNPLNTKSLILLAVATSIDALAVGVAFAFFSVNILQAIALIGGITIIMCYAGVVLGNKVGKYLKNYAEIVGGIILILIGISIFLQH
ncbi:MAG: manganese efflux pump MntP family protein [Turicibacter sp.]|nr:manganese efflux pump MntP family protein [Turicibacter sp.]